MLAALWYALTRAIVGTAQGAVHLWFLEVSGSLERLATQGSTDVASTGIHFSLDLDPKMTSI